MRALASAPVMSGSERPGSDQAAPARAGALSSSSGGARPGLDTVRAPTDAPLQLITFKRFTGRRRLWNWAYNADERQLMAREQETHDAINSLADVEAIPAHAARVAAMRQHLQTHAATEVDTADYATRLARLTALRGRAQAFGRQVRQDRANADGDVLHADTLAAHADIHANGVSTARLDALDVLQQRHSALMTHVHQHDLDLPLHDRAARRADGTYDQIQADWRTLSRTGNSVRMLNGGTPGLAADLRSVHGRLLAGVNGRSLVRDLVHQTAQPGPDGQPRPLTVSRLAPDDTPRATRQQRVANRAARRAGELHYSALRDQLNTEWDTATPERRAEIEASFPARVTDPVAVLQNQTYPSRLIEAQPPGSASPNGRNMSLREGLRDSEFVNEGTVADGSPHIPAPASVIYGHELVHAVRRLRGVGRGSADPIPGWDNEEEQATIEGAGAGPAGVNENALRDDYGIRHRRFHTSHSREEAGF